MSPSATIFVVGLIIGMIAGGAPIYGWFSYWEMEREKVEAEAAAQQEKENAKIVEGYATAIISVSDWYRDHPVRVRIQGSQECPGTFAPNAEDVVLTVGGRARGDGAATGSGLLDGNRPTGKSD